MQITSPNNRISLQVLEFGLTVHSLEINLSNGETIDVIPAPDVEDHKKSKFLHTIIGRYTNRIPVGNHQIDSSTSFTPQLVEGDSVSLHGGVDAFDKKLFAPIKLEQAQLYAENDRLPNHAMALFNYVSSSGENGYPGTMLVEAAFFLSDHSLILTHRAKMLDEVACPINLTQHWGFNLTADQVKSSTIADHDLYLNARSIAETDPATKLATGKSVAIQGTPFDFSTQRKIGDREIVQDHYYLFDRNARGIDKTIAHSLQDVKPATEIAQTHQPQLTLESGDVALRFHTNQSGVMFYAGGKFDKSAAHRKPCHVDDKDRDAAYPRHGSAFFEFHHPLATFLHDEYAAHANTSTILNKDEGNVYQNWAKIDVVVK